MQIARRDATDAPFRVERVEREGQTALRFEGRLTLDDARALWTATRDVARGVEGPITLDLKGVERVDGGALAVLVDLKGELEARGVRSELAVEGDAMRALVHLYRGDARVARTPRPRPEGTIAQIGGATLALLGELKETLAFVGALTLELVGIVRAPRSANWSAVLPTMERAGADAIPIVLLINFLIGFVTAFQAAAQLKQFGANIYSADLVGLALARELGPLMTAIIVAGRSGAAFAAELGTMKVSEEIDALRVLGLGPLRYLVVPRIVGLVLVMPILALAADAVGGLGGLLVATTSLDLSVTAYVRETQAAVVPWDVASGLLKSAVFGGAIALVGCQQGLAASGGAAGVGRRTTSSVVTMLFALVLIDAAFTVIFRVFGK